MTPALSPRQVIVAKRDGRELAPGTIEEFIRAFVAGEVADYQMAAFLMAAFLRGLTGAETAALTSAMVYSGRRLDLSTIPGIKVDKHSTGGVGDKISLPLAPLVAACGVPVPMISGRGLGHTGGTLDKLESIPGFRTRLPAEEFVSVLANVGYVMGGQTSDLAPADRTMYALRDVTGTVESIPLIVASILSKKVAEGARGLVMDVKCGRGAFMPDEARALELGQELARVGALLGVETVAFVTDMDAPLGLAIGNANEVEESIEILKGRGPVDVRQLTVTLGAAMLVVGGVATDVVSGMRRIEAAIADGSGLARFRRLVEAQGGDPRVIDDPRLLPQPSVRLPLHAAATGYVADLDPRAFGEAVIELGGGRRRAEDSVDPAVGIDLRRTRGEAVTGGDVLLEIRAADEATARRVRDGLLVPAIRIEPAPPESVPLIRRVVTRDGRTPRWDPSTVGTL